MTESEHNFLKAVVLPAQLSQSRTRVPTSITIAQAILESGWGVSRLAKEANNYFGIKATQATEEYVELPTTEFAHGVEEHILARFAKYSTVALCFIDHAQLLSCARRYAPAMAVANNPEKFATALQDCGYSTLEDSTGQRIYAQRLLQLVQEFDLTQYDTHPQLAA